MCQNQSIAESNAELAVDLRREINEQIRARAKRQRHRRLHGRALRGLRVVSTSRQAHTLLLWFGPALLAAAALIAFMRALRNRRRRAIERPLTDAEHAEAERLPRRIGQKQSVTTFVIIAVAMVTVALAWVLWPLLRPTPARSVSIQRPT